MKNSHLYFLCVFLISFFASANEMIDAIRTKDTKTVQTLLDTGFDPNQIVEGTPILFEALAMGGDEIAQLFLNASANINAVGDTYGTPLMMYIFCGNIHVIRFLLRNGANPLIRSRLNLPRHHYRGPNETPLELALRSQGNFHAGDITRTERPANEHRQIIALLERAEAAWRTAGEGRRPTQEAIEAMLQEPVLGVEAQTNLTGPVDGTVVPGQARTFLGGSASK